MKSIWNGNGHLWLPASWTRRPKKGIPCFPWTPTVSLPFRTDSKNDAGARAELPPVERLLVDLTGAPSRTTAAGLRSLFAPWRPSWSLIRRSALLPSLGGEQRRLLSTQKNGLLHEGTFFPRGGFIYQARARAFLIQKTVLRSFPLSRSSRCFSTRAVRRSGGSRRFIRRRGDGRGRSGGNVPYVVHSSIPERW
jgi:hypothetical protein